MWGARGIESVSWISSGKGGKEGVHEGYVVCGNDCDDMVWVMLHESVREGSVFGYISRTIDARYEHGETQVSLQRLFELLVVGSDILMCSPQSLDTVLLLYLFTSET
jgi:hypothetical protein